MSEMHGQSGFDELAKIYARLSEQHVEEFYSGYQLWYVQQHFVALQRQADTLRRQIAENTERLQQVQPSAVALASLARFQANGVTDMGLLDSMLERGEGWLDQTVQRLDYCERFDFIQGDYTHWCENALEGAFDWIDSIGEINSLEIAVEPEVADETLTEATEELLLQKLSSEEEEGLLLENTLKRAAVIPETPVENAEQLQDIARLRDEEQPQAGQSQEITLTMNEGVSAAESVGEVEIGQSEDIEETRDMERSPEFAHVGDEVEGKVEQASDEGQEGNAEQPQRIASTEHYDVEQTQIASGDDGAGETGSISDRSLEKQATIRASARASVVTVRRKRPGFLLRLVGALVKLFFG